VSKLTGADQLVRVCRDILHRLPTSILRRLGYWNAAWFWFHQLIQNETT